MEVEAELDIITIAHGHMELTIECIKAIYKNTSHPFHLIVMDDSTPDMDEGTDLTPEWLDKFASTHSNITIVHPAEPYKNSHHLFRDAFQYCLTPFAAVVVNSLLVEPDWADAGLQVLKSNPKIGVLGLKCLRYGTDLIESAGLAQVAQGGSLTDIGRGQSSHRFSRAYQCDAAQWAFVILRVEAVAPNLGADIYHGFKGIEEFEHEFTMREKGWEVWYCGLGVGYHKTLSTRLAREEIDMRLNLENKEMWMKRWGFWYEYHKYNGAVPEYFPDMEIREKRLPHIMLVDPTGVMKQKVFREYLKTEQK